MAAIQHLQYSLLWNKIAWINITVHGTSGTEIYKINFAHAKTSFYFTLYVQTLKNKCEKVLT